MKYMYYEGVYNNLQNDGIPWGEYTLLMFLRYSEGVYDGPEGLEGGGEVGVGGGDEEDADVTEQHGQQLQRVVHTCWCVCADENVTSIWSVHVRTCVTVCCTREAVASFPGSLTAWERG